MPRPRFEPVSECSICGNDFYESELTRHYKTNRLVDRLCADEPGADDYLEKMRRPVEHQKRAKQPVPVDENGYDAVEWATIALVNGIVGSLRVVGDNRAGILQVVAGNVNSTVSFQVTFGTPLATLPRDVVVSGWGPNGEANPVTGVSFTNATLTGFVTTRAYVTYQYRYEVIP